ncbi:hypothetical protein TorRG33x02_355920, partial [Trema orientale]
DTSLGSSGLRGQVLGEFGSIALTGSISIADDLFLDAHIKLMKLSTHLERPYVSKVLNSGSKGCERET